MKCYLLPEYDVYVVYHQVHLLGSCFIFTCNEVIFCLLSTSIMGVTVGAIYPRTYMHWTAVSAARGASRAAELAAKVTSAQDVLPTSGLLATAMEMPNIDRILAVNITV